jgi:hypothetical protein
VPEEDLERLFPPLLFFLGLAFFFIPKRGLPLYFFFSGFFVVLDFYELLLD